MPLNVLALYEQLRKIAVYRDGELFMLSADKAEELARENADRYARGEHPQSIFLQALRQEA